MGGREPTEKNGEEDMLTRKTIILTDRYGQLPPVTLRAQYDGRNFWISKRQYAKCHGLDMYVVDDDGEHFVVVDR